MGRAPCCDKSGLKKGPWTPEEDQKLMDYIQKHGYGNWRTLPKNAGLQRCGKSCRLRWTNYLRPDIKRGRFSFEEEETIIQLHSILGNKWSAIAARLPGRTDNEIKNYWNTHIRKRLLRMGIDPVTHIPRLDLLDFSSILYNSSHHHHQMNNFSRLLGQPIGLNPELLRLATSLIQSHRESNSNQNFVLQNAQENDYHQICNPQIQVSNQVQCNQLQQPIQHNVPYANEAAQIMQQQPNVEYPSSLSDFRSQISQHNEWQSNAGTSNFTEEYVELPSFAYFGSEQNQTVLDISPETSNIHSNNSNQNFSFTSVFSTPSSSPTPMNSNSTTYFNSGTEDERESYCSNMLKFDIPSILDVNEFM
ncbi:hypothetical protein ACFX2J_005081 [Malus domestica]|uniref:transcription factor MYB74-like n=1 Tax=Malus domestica TaxID=3750 RepID=UPI0010A9BEC6|nr:transcription factor MYB74-like [Malus domestica]